MIDQADAQLKDWLGSVLAETPVSFAPPSDGQAGRGISLYLLEIVPIPPVGDARRLPLQLALRYMVTTWTEPPEEAHRLLGEIVFAAMQKPDVEVEFNLIPLTAWPAFGIKPRPYFVLRVPLRVERPEPPIMLVRKPIVMKTALITSLSGVILTPEDTPLVGAQVKLPGLQLSARTDSNGRFSFPAVPIEPHTKQLSVTAKGREQAFQIEQPDSEHASVVIRFNIE